MSDPKTKLQTSPRVFLFFLKFYSLNDLVCTTLSLGSYTEEFDCRSLGSMNTFHSLLYKILNIQCGFNAQPCRKTAEGGGPTPHAKLALTGAEDS